MNQSEIIMNQSNGKTNFFSSLKSMLNKNFILLMLISVFNQFGTTMDTQIITIRGQDIGMVAGTITLMATLYSVATMVARPFAGRLTDKLNLKLWLIIIMFLKAITFIFQGIAPTSTLLILSRVCTGAVFCAVTGTVATMSSMFVDRRAMGTAMGLVSGIPGLLVSSAPVLAVYLYQNMSPATSYFVAALASIPCIIFAMFLDVKKSAPKVKHNSNAEKKGFDINNYICLPALPICMITFCTASLLFACSLLVVTMSRERGLANIAIFFTTYTLFKAVGAIGGGFLGDLMSAKHVIIPGLIMNAICCVLLANGHTEFAIGVAGALYAVSYQSIMNVTRKASALMAPIEQRGSAISTNMLIIDIAGITGTMIPGMLYSKLGYTTTFYCMLAYPILGFIIYLCIAKKIAAAEQGN